MRLAQRIPSQIVMHVAASVLLAANYIEVMHRIQWEFSRSTNARFLHLRKPPRPTPPKTPFKTQTVVEGFLACC
ncbi:MULTISPECIES: hypothetical protein [Roseobacteraceae]|jgi:hypothetical protein|uniref:hypothetical protein n=1 Tax=Roseobacteraceae TaxID=2854170 RepID=UPI0012FF0E55|nr:MULTISPECIES: hypothetical protein [Roseobacteraceae]MDD9709841.1 hypothetical protein [Seohaeicola sp. 4SK31]MDD9738037.1 hypothetical protein [Seohaeicola sp. SP36]URF48783.1 hypothetical protein M8008_18885 [Dinoroseobacter shibae]URF48813.1 hypothetical protein M8008_19895 [Dinoroseobacter shibae]URF49115.1 hypothetical protein M8008_20905 [Dinoroseobacter shibae]|tara:strand:+ start:128 stop:349 length:222 start_codon:yes stop_codon:yes gene_type:complete